MRQSGEKFIILTDDDQDDIEILCQVLNELNNQLEYIIAEDGEKLMTFLAKLIKLPDLIFLDINMPRKNGFQCLKEIKSHPDLKRIKVIMLSTASDTPIIDLAYELGADFYIVKPTDYNQFREAIKKCLELVQ